MSELLNAIILKRDSSFSFQNGTQRKTTIEIDNSQFKKLLNVLGADGLVMHLTLLSCWDDRDGLPSVNELANYLDLTKDVVVDCVQKLINTRIDGVLLYDKNELHYRNPNGYDIYKQH